MTRPGEAPAAGNLAGELGSGMLTAIKYLPSWLISTQYGAIPATHRRGLDGHLAGCPHCAEYLAQIRATITAVGTVTSDDLDPANRRDLIALYRKTIR